MSRRDDNVTLRQMLDHVQEAITLTQGRARVGTWTPTACSSSRS